MRFPRKMSSMLLSGVMALGMFSTQAFALEYEYDTDAPGQPVYQITSRMPFPV